MFQSLRSFVVSKLSTREESEITNTLNKAFTFEAFISQDRQREYQDLLECICRYSNFAESRIEIVHYLRYSYSPKNPHTEWRTTLNGLRILDFLITNGEPLLFREFSNGQHFDITQSTQFLTSYHHTDERVGNLIQSVAKSVRRRLLSKLSATETEPPPDPNHLKSISYSDIIKRERSESGQISIGNVMIFPHSETTDDRDADNIDPLTTPDVSTSLIDLL
jgi:hypothetical protein